MPQRVMNMGSFPFFRFSKVGVRDLQAMYQKFVVKFSVYTLGFSVNH